MFGAVGGSNDRHLPDGGESWSRVHVKPKLVIILEYMYLRKYQMYKYINIPYNIIHIPYNIIYIWIIQLAPMGLDVGEWVVIT
jgi:hypothetical protein